MDLSGKKILVLGAGISGFAAAKNAKKLGARVILSDAKNETDLKYDFRELKSLGIELAFGAQNETLLDGADAAILSPSVPVAIPLVKSAVARGIKIMSEVEFAARLAESPIAAVTGTNGKTTTVTLLGLLLQTHYDKVGVGGNIGVALSDVALETGKGGAIAAEISSYQMEATDYFHPHVSAILNVTPDHIKRHGSMETYQQMKEKIFADETAEDFLVLNYDDERSRSIEKKAKCRTVFFGKNEIPSDGAFVSDGILVIRFEGKTHELVTINELGIKGAHNVENALAASLCAFLMDAEPEKMRPKLKNFSGVEHRIEFVADIDGVPYYNDSKATNTDSAEKALLTFDDGIVLIAGGDDKGTDLSSFMRLVCERATDLVLIGDAAKRFKEAAVKAGFSAAHIFEAGYSMKDAVAIAKNVAHAPQVVLLSPACASFDMYSDFEARGRDFKTIVKNLAQKN